MFNNPQKQFSDLQFYFYHNFKNIFFFFLQTIRTHNIYVLVEFGITKSLKVHKSTVFLTNSHLN